VPRPHHRFTIYDALAAKGAFDSNPANAGATGPEGQVLYSGPVLFPMMFYHPEGKQRITTPATPVAQPDGVKYLGEQREIIWRLARNEDEARTLADAGWHDHPAKAIAASGAEAPDMGQGDYIKKLERQLAEVKGQLATQAAKLEELE
jgi:hypothetical protein